MVLVVLQDAIKENIVATMQGIIEKVDNSIQTWSVNYISDLETHVLIRF